ncbi:MAG TPA: hypothetical protein PK400_06510, partial [Phycisphaerales bacterium]|nr:hypothetical protein [Phycisphaerales bacterium]
VLEHYMRTNPPRDATRAEEFALALDRMRLNDRALAAAAREALVRDMLARRSALIASPALSLTSRAVHLADQAADAYFELLPIEASGLAALFGMPTAAQRDRAAEAARIMYESARSAESALQDAMLALDQRLNANDDDDARQQRRRLAEEERDRRIPFLLGVGAELHARFNVHDSAERTRLHTLALRLLSPLTEILEGAPANDAALYAGLAAASLNRADDAVKWFAQAESSADALTRFAARVARAQLDPRSNALLLTMERDHNRPGQAFLRVLLADAQFRHALRFDPAGAYDSYVRLLEAPIGMDGDDQRDLVRSRLAIAVPAAPHVKHDAPLVVIALAEHHAGGADAREREAAIESLSGLLDRRSLDDRDRALALFALGRALHHADRPADAAARLIELARDHPRAAEAERAIEFGLSLAAQQYVASPREHAALVKEALRVAMDQYAHMQGIDRWRLLGAQVALAEHRHMDAASLAAQIPRESAFHAEAQALRVAALRQHALAAATDFDRAARFREMIVAAQEALNEAEFSADRSNRIVLVQVRLAEAQLALGETDRAIETLAAIDESDSFDALTLNELLRVRLAAFGAAGRVDEAVVTLDRLLAASPQHAGQTLSPLLASIDRRVNALLDAGREEQATVLIRRELKPVASRAEAWIASSSASREVIAMLRGQLAEAHRLAGDFALAQSHYDRLLRDEPNAAAWLLGRAECLFHQSAPTEEDYAEAMRIYRRLIAAGDAAGEQRLWLAHLRSLQILDATSRNTHQIAPQIQRLRQADASLGGERFRRHFERLQNKYAP